MTMNLSFGERPVRAPVLHVSTPCREKAPSPRRRACCCSSGRAKTPQTAASAGASAYSHTAQRARAPTRGGLYRTRPAQQRITAEEHSRGAQQRSTRPPSLSKRAPAGSYGAGRAPRHPDSCGLLRARLRTLRCCLSRCLPAGPRPRTTAKDHGQARTTAKQGPRPSKMSPAQPPGGSGLGSHPGR